MLDEFSGLRARSRRPRPPERTQQVASHIDDYNGRGQYVSGIRTERCGPCRAVPCCAVLCVAALCCAGTVVCLRVVTS